MKPLPSIDFADPEAVERLLDDAGKQAAEAWTRAAKATQALPKPIGEEAGPLVEMFGALTAHAAKANLDILQRHAEMVASFATASSNAFRLMFEVMKSSQSTSDVNNRFAAQLEKMQQFYKDLEASTQSKVPANNPEEPAPHVEKRRATR
jgi:hypothetical protein